MPDPWDPAALWIKAKLFINRAMDPGEERTFDERALWASLALELLAKTALARHSPVLIATPSEDGSSLLAATGLIPRTAKFNTVPAKTLYARCAKAFRPFDETKAMAITGSRNEYLHGPGAAFVGLPPDVWWASFWAQATILVHACDKTIEDFVGPQRRRNVEDHLERNRENVQNRVETLVARARQRLKMIQAGQLPGRVMEELGRRGELFSGAKYYSSAPCPACDQEGVLEGDEVEGSTRRVEWGGYDLDNSYLVIDVTVAAEHFACEACGLVLDSYELVDEAGLPTSFDAEGDADDFVEPDYGND